MPRTLLFSVLLVPALLALALKVQLPALGSDQDEAPACASVADAGVTDSLAGGEAPVAPGDDGTGSAVASHEPEGMVPLACFGFRAADREGGWWPFDDELDLPPGWKAGERRYLHVGTDGARARFPRGWKGGSAPTWIERDLSGSESGRLFLSFRIRLSDHWQSHPVNDKLLYVWAHDDPVVFPVYVGGGQSPLTTEIRLQDMPGGARNLAPNVGPAGIERGRWHRWEILLETNGIGRADGEVRWWIDGREVGHYTDVRFGSVQEDRIWERVSWRPVWGGAGGEVRQDQFMWIDDLYVSGAP